MALAEVCGTKGPGDLCLSRMPPLQRAKPSPLPRASVALVIGMAGALTHYLKVLAVPAYPGDFGLAWLGARELIQGGNPYELIGPGLAYDWPWRLKYPATAMIAAMPLAVLPQLPATLLFVFISCALLAWSITARAWYPLLMCSSVAFLIAAGAAQWSPILTAAMALPPLGFLFAAKPTVGFALAISGSRQLQWFALAGLVVTTAISLMLFRQWPRAWVKSLSTAVQVAPPLLRMGGFAILLALLRWRRPEARLMVALAYLPATIIVLRRQNENTIPPWTAPRSR